ncbi:hypothetical protein SAMN04489841_3903 [Natrinema salaciae]|uniref:Uncharacterized protein n=1 Tax=Natrinema salaciae TaxID=1186196 RepID=A0A1H9P9Z8_9EURY|nr:hypothetical protein SAMN04489841_3903 [Natrinema salaciae]
MMPTLRESNNKRDRGLSEEITALQKQLSEMQTEQRYLRNALFGLARESDMSLGSPCPKCEKSYMLIKQGLMSCPSCQNRLSV